MATSILVKFLTLKWNILRTIWRIEVGDGSFFRIFHVLSFELNFFFDRRFPLTTDPLIAATISYFISLISLTIGYSLLDFSVMLLFCETSHEVISFILAVLLALCNFFLRSFTEFVALFNYSQRVSSLTVLSLKNVFISDLMLSSEKPVIKA